MLRDALPLYRSVVRSPRLSARQTTKCSSPPSRHGWLLPAESAPGHGVTGKPAASSVRDEQTRRISALVQQLRGLTYTALLPPRCSASKQPAAYSLGPDVSARRHAARHLAAKRRHLCCAHCGLRVTPPPQHLERKESFTSCSATCPASPSTPHDRSASPRTRLPARQQPLTARPPPGTLSAHAPETHSCGAALSPPPPLRPRTAASRSTCCCSLGTADTRHLLWEEGESHRRERTRCGSSWQDRVGPRTLRPSVASGYNIRSEERAPRRRSAIQKTGEQA